jgi:hypothetical protein
MRLEVGDGSIGSRPDSPERVIVGRGGVLLDLGDAEHGQNQREQDG